VETAQHERQRKKEREIASQKANSQAEFTSHYCTRKIIARKYKLSTGIPTSFITPKKTGKKKWNI
jgi:hypothetical protein